MILVLTLVAPIQTLECGHACGGICDEKTHVECLQVRPFRCFLCVIESTLRGQCKPSADDDAPGGEWCAICYVDALEAAPVIKLQCGHLLHFGCVQRRLAARWAGPVIGFQVLPTTFAP